MRQNVLPLPDNPENRESLRAAYEKTRLKEEGISFAQALQNEAIRKCLANINEARLRAGKPGSPSIRASALRAPPNPDSLAPSGVERTREEG